MRIKSIDAENSDSDWISFNTHPVLYDDVFNQFLILLYTQEGESGPRLNVKCKDSRLRLPIGFCLKEGSIKMVERLLSEAEQVVEAARQNLYEEIERSRVEKENLLNRVAAAQGGLYIA